MLVRAAQNECSVRVPLRIQCNTSKRVHSEGGYFSRRRYGHFSERNGPIRIYDALHFRTSGHNDCESKISKELSLTSSRLLGQINIAPCTTGI